MRLWLAWFAVPFLLQAEEHWPEIHSGPFYVLSGAGERPAREQMMQLEQFRYELGQVLGKQDLRLVWPLWVVVAKADKRGVPSAPIALARDAYMVSSAEGVLLAHERLRELALILIEQNMTRLPPGIEGGLADLFSTTQVNGTHITLGTPPAQRTRDWARMRLLICNPDYAGRARVLFSNLEQIPDLNIAYRNAFEKQVKQIEQQVDAEVAAGVSATTVVAGRALSEAHDFHIEQASADEIQLAQADLLLASGSSGADAAFTGLHGAEAAEGLGILALKAAKRDEARRLFQSAIDSESKSARVWFETGMLEADSTRAGKDFEKAAELNPRWAEPPYRHALRETDLARRGILLKRAATLDPRNVEYWQTLAKNETEAERFPEAQKAWAGAERAAVDDAERKHIRQVRLDLTEERAEHDEAERRRKAEEEARDLQRVKDASMAAIHEAEANAGKKLNPNGAPPPKPDAWWTGPDAGAKVEGTLERFVCTGRTGKLVVRTSDRKLTSILVSNPSGLAVSGGAISLACGPQNPPRSVVVLYNPKADKRLGTAGEAASIEIR